MGSPFCSMKLRIWGFCSPGKLVLQSMDEESRKELTPIKLRKKAAKFARDTVNVQMKSFKVFIL